MKFFLVSALLVAVLVAVVAVYDLIQTKHAILRAFPVIGHFRYLLEAVGPELRQYIVTGNDEERPFSRDQRRWVYSVSKRENQYFGFGSDNEMESSDNYIVVLQSSFPHPPPENRNVPCAKVLGAAMGRKNAFRPASIVNVSAMSFGSLSSAAVRAINLGVKQAGAWQNTGEGGISPHHLLGGDLVWQIGTGYFGCRDKTGRFSKEKFLETTASIPQIRAIEIKISQGAKPGVGGILPGVKVTPEISAIRGVPVGVACISPPSHSAFHDPDSMLDFVEDLADSSGLPVGIKSAVGELDFWRELARLMAKKDRGVDYISIDGGEGGTGAGPLVFADHVALPFKVAFSRVYRIFAEEDLTDRVVFVGTAKLGFPEQALLAFSLGCDLIGVAREAMLAIGCVQAQRCHTDRCPTGVTTHRPMRVRGLVPEVKSVRLANYISQLRQEVLDLSLACGVPHPSLVTTDSIEILDSRFGTTSATEIFGYRKGWGLPSAEDMSAIKEIMAEDDSNIALQTS